MITVVANLKGGTGKSTLTFNLAVWLSSMGTKTTVVDLDPQRTLSDVAAVRLEEGIEPPIHVRTGPFEDVSLPMGAREVLIDVGTADLESFRQALMLADRVLIPVTPSQADVWSTQRFVRFLHKSTQGNPPESLAIINRADTNQAVRAADEAAVALTSLPGVRLISQRLFDRAVFRDSFSEGLAVFELEPRSKGSVEFKLLAEALFGQKGAAAKVRPTRQRAPSAASPVGRYAPDTSAVEQSAALIRGNDEDQTVAAAEEAVGKGGKAPGGKKKHRAAEDRKADKGKKHKKGKKEKQAGMGGKAKKDKKSKKGKKGKKAKKGK